MRYINKYKYFDTLPINIVSVPTRVLKFNRPKWQKCKTVLHKKISTCNIDNSITKLRFKSWERLQNYFKEGFQLKISINLLFDSVITVRHYKMVLKKNYKQFSDIFFYNLIKLHYRLDILLWKLNFFKSVFEAEQALKSNKILVNGKISSNTLLKKGDIIQLSGCNFSNIKVLKIIPFFLEVDYYTMSVIVIKDFQNLNFQDLSFFFKDFVDIRKFVDYIRTK